MLRKGSAGLLRQALQYGLQQPVQQSCVQLQVLSLQAVRFRSKPSHPKHRFSKTRSKKAEIIQQHMVERALDRKGIPFNLFEDSGIESPSKSAAAAATSATSAANADNSSSSSSSQASAQTPADAGQETAASSADSSSTSDSSSSSVFPDWMRGMMGLSSRKRSRPPAVKPSPLTPQSAIVSAADKEASEKRIQQAAEPLPRPQGAPDQQGEGQEGESKSDGWEKTMIKFKDFSLDDYTELMKSGPNNDSDTPPKPNKPTRGYAAYYGTMHDQQRCQFYRMEQHRRLINNISTAEKLEIKMDPNIHKNLEFMERVADKSALTLDAVRDAIVTFQKYRLEYRVIYDYWNAGNKLPPMNDQYGFEVCKRNLMVKHEQKKIKSLLALRDVAKCELRKHAAAVSKAHVRKICPQTELPYGQCCGRNSRLMAKDARKTKQVLLRTL